MIRVMIHGFLNVCRVGGNRIADRSPSRCVGTPTHTGTLWLGLLVSAFLGISGPAKVWAASKVSEEYQIKAAFLYNFMKFVEWPKERFSGDKAPIVIGVVGKDPFGEVLDQIAQKSVKDRPLVVKRFEPTPSENGDPVHPQIDAIRQCHMLFICASEKKIARRLAEAIIDVAVLTVGDTQGFMEDGVMINFLIADGKIGFEIGLAKARLAKLDVSSQLLRLAKRVDKGKEP